MSKKTGRGPLVANWRETCEPYMCAYKLVTLHFKWFGFQSIVENYGHKVFFYLITIFTTFRCSNILVYFQNFIEKCFVGLMNGMA